MKTSIDDLEVTLSADRTSNISLLPADVVVLIFELDANDNPIKRHGDVAVKDTWLRLGRVSRAWRVVLFDMLPHIWARDIFQFRPERALRLLPLTRQTLLNLDLWSTNTGSDVIDSLYSLVPRSSRVVYTRECATLDLYTIFKILSTTSLPHLGELYISIDQPRHKYTLPSLAGHRNLRQLALKNVFMRPPFGNSLLSLSLAFPWLKPEHRPTLEKLLELIYHHDGLQTLALDCAVFVDAYDRHDRHAGVAGQAKITLAALTSLTLIYNDLESILLLDHLLLPALHEAVIHLASVGPGPIFVLCYKIIESLLRAWTGINGVAVPRLLNTVFVQNPFDRAPHPLFLIEELGGLDKLVSEAGRGEVAVTVKKGYRAEGARVVVYVFEISM